VRITRIDSWKGGLKYNFTQNIIKHSNSQIPGIQPSKPE
jgi:hypothetical protein